MKTQDIKSLQIIYNIQAGIGLLFTVFGTFLVSVMSTDAPNYSNSGVFISGLFSFILLFTITIGLPIAAHRELENFYTTKRKLIFNSIDTLLMFFIFFPVAILQLLLLSKIHKNISDDNNKSSIIEHKESKALHKTEDFDKYAEQRLKELDKSLKQYNKSLERNI